MTPSQAKRYASQIEHVFPNFTTKNCEGCHVTSSFSSGKTTDPLPTYEVPDQSQTIPGLLSASNEPEEHGGSRSMANGNPVYPAPASRNIGSVPSYVVGPCVQGLRWLPPRRG